MASTSTFPSAAAATTLGSSSSTTAPASSSSSDVVSTAPPTSTSLLGLDLSSNPYFSAGFGLMLFGSVLALSRKGASAAAGIAQRRLLVSLEVASKDRAHPWLLAWLAAQAAAQASNPALRKEGLRALAGLNSDKEAFVSPTRIFSHELAVETSFKAKADEAAMLGGGQSNANGERGEARFSLVPGPGTHWFRYRGNWMKLQRERNAKMIDLSTGAPWETITLTTLRSSRGLFPLLLAEARALAEQSVEGKTIIYTAWGAEWRPFGKPRRARDLGSVVLKRGVRERIEGDVRAFMQRGAWYRQRGIPYRRGYLLHGAPGSGKSSFITALAGALDQGICVLNLSERGLTDSKLTHLLAHLPDSTILLLEDIDAAFHGRAAPASEDGFVPGVTFSGLLNALDGVASAESRVVFMTTNHVERLDPALIRPGRVDLMMELGDADGDQAKELLARFYAPQSTSETEAAPASSDASTLLTNSPSYTPEQIEALGSSLAQAVASETLRRRSALGLDPTGRHALGSPTSPAPTNAVRPAARGGVSMAELQGLFIRFPDDAEAAVVAFKRECEEMGREESVGGQAAAAAA